MTTLAELNAQSAALKLALAEHEAPLFSEASEILARLQVSDDVKRLAAITADLPDSQLRDAVRNVGAAIDATLGRVSIELPGLAAIIAPPQPAPSPAPIPQPEG